MRRTEERNHSIYFVRSDEQESLGDHCPVHGLDLCPSKTFWRVRHQDRDIERTTAHLHTVQWAKAPRPSLTNNTQRSLLLCSKEIPNEMGILYHAPSAGVFFVSFSLTDFVDFHKTIA